MSCCDDHEMTSGASGPHYTCPMHPEVKKEKPGNCPKCGMPLVPSEEKGGGSSGGHQPEAHADHSGHEEHDHGAMMAGEGAAGDFFGRFLIVTILLLPLALFSEPAIKFLGVPDFPLRAYFEFAIASAIFYFALIFFSHTRHEIKARKYGMMTLVSLGVGSGYLFSAASTFIPAIKTEFYLEISTLIWVLLFGHFLEAKSSAAAGDALQEVAKLLPSRAHRIKNKRSEDVELKELKENDIVLVKPGEKVPADGVIVKGQSSFNESHITGESKPIEKKVNDKVVAGGIAIDGSVEVKLERVGENSTIGQIAKLIAQARQTKPAVQRLADKVASLLTFTALAVAVITLLVWTLVVGEPLVTAATLAITVLVITCPHALGLAIPTVSTIATTMAVKNGVFLKNLEKLEATKDVNYVVFDKTGTLTKGEFGVTDLIALRESSDKLLQIAAGLEAHSSHVIGMAIVKFAKQKGTASLEATDFKNLAGKGIQGKIGNKDYLVGNKTLIEERALLSKEGKNEYEKLAQEGKTTVFVVEGSRIIGLIALSDSEKEESALAVTKLHALGVKVAMLTGDSAEVAKSVAGKLGIDTHFAQVLPEKKYEYVRKLQEEGNTVMMVGDGVNDAPALTQGDVGVAIGAGTDVAVEAGDIVLTRNNPLDVVSLILLSKKVYRKMVENLIWAAGYNVVAIPAAAGLFLPLGFRLTPAIGALLMSLSSVIVVINALTLKKATLAEGR